MRETIIAIIISYWCTYIYNHYALLYTLIQQNRVQICLMKVHTFIQLLYVLQTNLFTFTESDLVHSFPCIYSKVKSGAGRIVSKFKQVTYCELECFTQTNYSNIFTNHLLKIFAQNNTRN